MATTEEIKEFLGEPRTLAIVGASTKEKKAGHYVPKFLKEERGFTIIPVNPFEDEILGEDTIDDLTKLDTKIDGVVVYRNPEAAEKEALKAIDLKDKLSLSWIWFPDGVTSDKVKEEVAKTDLKFEQDNCPMRFTKENLM